MGQIELSINISREGIRQVMLLDTPDWPWLTKATFGIIGGSSRKEETLVLIIGQSRLSMSNVMSGLELDLMESIHSSHSVLEKGHLDSITELVFNLNEVFISPEFVTPMKDERLGSTTPVGIKFGRGEVSQQGRRVKCGLCGGNSMLLQLAEDSLGIIVMGMLADKVLAHISLESGLKHRVDELQLFIKEIPVCFASRLVGWIKHIITGMGSSGGDGSTPPGVPLFILLEDGVV